MKRNDHYDWTIYKAGSAPLVPAPRPWNGGTSSSLASAGSQLTRPTAKSRPRRKLPARRPSILVPVDGEQFGEHALPLALGIARRSGAEVRIVTVYSPFKSFSGLDRHYYDSNLDAFFRRRQRLYLDDLLSRLTRVTPICSAKQRRARIL
jgi:hypothetical protein